MEYKFRGKPCDPSANGFEFVYGGYYKEPIDERAAFPEEFTIIVTDNLEHISVIPETVGQFVGLQDKNGKDIYEGDKIEFYTREMIKHSGIVKFKSCSFYIDDEDWASYFAWDDYSMIEITGNIHEK